MGDRLTGEQNPGQTSHQTYGDIFDELFPQYLLMGMTAEQYWDGESSLKPAYRKAYRSRIEAEQRIADINNWHMGQYILKALQAVPLFVAGFNTKGVTLPEYPDKPLLEKAEEQKREEDRKKREEDQIKLAMAMMQATFAKFNKNFEKRKKQQQPEDGEGSGQ